MYIFAWESRQITKMMTAGYIQNNSFLSISGTNNIIVKIYVDFKIIPLRSSDQDE